jgi:hypothetical protein
MNYGAAFFGFWDKKKPILNENKDRQYICGTTLVGIKIPS